MEKTGIVSIRIYENEKNHLNTESQKKNMTVNSLGRQIISKHIAWHRYAKDMGYTCVTKSLLELLFKNADKNTINDISTNTHTTLKNTILFIHGEINIQNTLSVLDTWLDACNISFRHFTDFHIEKYVISHNMGKRFSEYLEVSINSVLEEVEHVISNQTLDELHITFEIERVQK